MFVSAVSERVPLDPCRTSQLPAEIKYAVLIDHLVDSEGNIVRAVSIALTTRPARLAVCVISAGLIYKGHLPLDQRASGGTKITRCRLRRVSRSHSHPLLLQLMAIFPGRCCYILNSCTRP